jgi:DNA-binding response OmpR family regulator
VEIATRPGEGTLFRILVPRALAALATCRRTRSRGEPKRILVVEDEQEIGEAIRHRLEGAGYRASLLTDPRLALQVLEAGTTFDLVVTDLNMPHLPGDGLARQVRRGRSELPFLLISSQAAFLNAGNLFSAVVRKPVDYAELLGKIEEIIL